MMRDLRPQDLRLGNYLENFLGEYFRVNTTTLEVLLGSYRIGMPLPKPIRLTHDLVKQFGYRVRPGCQYYISGDQYYLVVECNRFLFMRNGSIIKVLYYVHELQNAYHFVHNIDIEIEL